MICVPERQQAIQGEANLTRVGFIAGMRQLASSVSVVTTDGPAGRAGVTVSAVCSVSADPPSLLVCIHHLSPVCDALDRNGGFCVNVLDTEQVFVSEVFAGRIEAPSGDKFACASWRSTGGGFPVLEDSLAVFECRVVNRMRQGTHCVFVAQVVGVASASGRPLVRMNQRYVIAAPLPAAVV